MRHEVIDAQKRFDGAQKVYVLSKPNWFERFFQKRESKMYELVVSKRMWANKVATAIMINAFLKSKK